MSKTIHSTDNFIMADICVRVGCIYYTLIQEYVCIVFDSCSYIVYYSRIEEVT